MRLIKTIFREIFGLFVDDGSFAILILVWVAVAWLLQVLHILVESKWSAPLLFFGLVVILLESAIRRARN